ncbi:hypothetical protein COL922a_005738 [Colletotrichum nupharicola]|nr:hypothetical protein COL922a_005738 [Colletotrichum nupharicola]
MPFILDTRIPKGGGSSGGRGSSGKSSSSKSKSKSSKSKYKSKGGYAAGGGAGGGSGGNNGFAQLPVWARVLIILAIIWFILFLIAFTYYLMKELKRKKEGKSFRLGHVFGHALLVSTGLWIPVFLYKKFIGSKKEKSGTYAKIGEGHGKEGNNHDSWYGGTAGVENKYDPVSGPPPYRPQSPNPAPAPAPVPAQTGAAADYYMPQPPSHTAPTQHPPQYG